MGGAESHRSDGKSIYIRGVTRAINWEEGPSPIYDAIRKTISSRSEEGEGTNSVEYWPSGCTGKRNPCASARNGQSVMAKEF